MSEARPHIPARPAGKEAPSPPPPRSPAPEAILAPRLEALLAQGQPSMREETDLADAVCALLRPEWSRYDDPLDLSTLQGVLDARPILEVPQLNRLAGFGTPKPLPQLAPPPPPTVRPAPRPPARRPRKPARPPP